MGARDLLARLAGAGVTVAAEGDQLLIRPASKLTDDMRGELRALKPAVLALLAAPEAHLGDSPPFSGVFLTEAPVSKVQGNIGEAVRKVRPESGNSVRFEDRHARLIRWGWPQSEAHAMAERLARRDLTGDDRVSCTECGAYRPGRCGNHRRAGLFFPDVGRDLAALLQHCPGFKP